MKKMRKETVADSFACAFSASCSYDAIKAQAEQETAAFQRELERQEKRAAHQREKEKKAKEQELREREREEWILERRTRNAEEKYFKCPACGCSFKLTRGWFLNKKECFEKINFLKASVYKEHTCPYCKSVVRLETGEIRYLIKEPYYYKDIKDYPILLPCDSNECFYSHYVSKQEFLFSIKKKAKKSAAKIAAVAAAAGVLICLGTFATVEVSDKIKSRNAHTDITVQYIGRFGGILDDDGEGVGAWGFYNEAKDTIYWCDETNPFQPFYHYSDEIGDVGTMLEMQYYPKRSKVKFNGHTFRKIQIEKVSKEKVCSFCEWMT